MAPFLDAWILATQGRAPEIECPFRAKKLLLERSSDSLSDFGMDQTAKHILASRHMSTAGLAG